MQLQNFQSLGDSSRGKYPYFGDSRIPFQRSVRYAKGSLCAKNEQNVTEMGWSLNY